MLQRHIGLTVFLVVQHGMAMRESTATNVLPGQRTGKP
jgi:hypothetical protein